VGAPKTIASLASSCASRPGFSKRPFLMSPPWIASTFTLVPATARAPFATASAIAAL
jgi:hypothetical protein